MTPDIRQVVIPKEDAVFWMDGNGAWHNEHGKFEHPKIIAHFNRSIRKDASGYHVYQKSDEVEEKVYFVHGETAVFVVDVSLKDPMRILLNTGARLDLDPTRLYSENDGLYLETPEHLVKFTSRALVKLSAILVDEGGTLALRTGAGLFPIEER